MNFTEFSQFSPLVATIFIIFFVVKYFTKAIETKDRHLYDITEQFNETMNNHLKHATESQESLTKAIQELTKEIKNGHEKT